MLPRLMSSLKSRTPSNAGYAVGFENAVEQREPVTLRVKGEIPPWLTGRLYRTGPGTFRVPSKKAPGEMVNLAHWFDGLGMAHRFDITPSGSVLYRSHHTSLGLQSRLEKAGAMVGVSFGDQDPCETIFSKFFTMFRPGATQVPSPRKGAPDDVNVSVTLTPDMPGFASHASTLSTTSPKNVPRYLVAKTDADTLQVLDSETLRPLHATTYKELDPRLDGQLSAAHSCRDKETGEFFNYSLKLGPRPTYKVFRLRPTRNGEGHECDILAEITDAPPAYLHSFAMTQNYVVLCVWQADFTFFGASIPFNRSIAGSINKKWNSKRDALFYVIDRKAGGVVAKFKTPPFFAFHAINAYDRGTGIVLDLAIYDDHRVIDLFYLDTLRNLSAENPVLLSRARRFILEDVLSSKGAQAKVARDAKVEYTVSHTSSIDLPTVHPALYHKPYRFAYGINKSDPALPTFADRIVKLDMDSPGAEPKAWAVPGYTPGEPVFVPKPGSSPIDQEDDGVVLSVVLDGDSGKSMLVVLDAREMTELARAEMDTHFPISFHGVWAQQAKW